MRLTVRVKPKSKQPRVTDGGDGSLIVAVHEAPTDGHANAAVIKAMAEAFRRVTLPRPHPPRAGGSE